MVDGRAGRGSRAYGNLESTRRPRSCDGKHTLCFIWHPHARIVTCWRWMAANAKATRSVDVNVFCGRLPLGIWRNHPLCTVVVRGRAACTPCHMASGAGIAGKRRRQAGHAVLHVYVPPLLGGGLCWGFVFGLGEGVMSWCAHEGERVGRLARLQANARPIHVAAGAGSERAQRGRRLASFLVGGQANARLALAREPMS